MTSCHNMAYAINADKLEELSHFTATGSWAS